MIEVQHRLGQYAIDFVSIGEIRKSFPENAIVITDRNVARIYPQLLDDLPHLIIGPGERSKSLHQFGHIGRKLAMMQAKRSTTLIALGGGVVGDLAGYVASAYMRGVPLLQVPTTLLAQVDSSVGGKVGVDLPEGKNLVGAFYPPSRVLIAPEFCATLSPRQFRNGMAEVLKYGLILDKGLLGTLEGKGLTPTSTHLASIIERCVVLKKEVVEADELETTGLRAVLNFGHTIGHAIEKVLNYRRLLHGEAISIGMVLEARLGEQIGVTEKGTTTRAEALLNRFRLPTRLNLELDAELLIDAMKGDKKAVGSQGLSFSLLTTVGHCKLVHGVSESTVRDLLRNR